jgi:hypothetical protein
MNNNMYLSEWNLFTSCDALTGEEYLVFQKLSDVNQTISITVLAFISDSHATFTLASSPQKYSEYFPI